MKKTLFNLFAALMVLPAFSQIDAGPDVTICGPQPVTLTATVTGQMGTTAYTVASIPWAPEVVGGTVVFLSDDAVSSALPIGFSFCFLGNSYTNFYIGSNGWVGFTAGQPTTYTSASVPSTGANVPKNCIMGPWQDWHPGISPSNFVKYQTIGTAPNRKLVVTWDNCPMFSCTSVTGKFQIVLHETSNFIDNHIFNKQYCAWGGGTATQAIHNATGTIAYAIPGRNSTVWTATNESWRYTPAGVQWLVNGVPVSTANPYTVTPQATTTYTASVPLCGANTVTDQVTVTVGAGLGFQNSLVTGSSCTNSTGDIDLVITSNSAGPFTFEWNDPGQSTSEDLYDVSPGTYTVVVTDQSTGCEDDQTFVVEENSTLSLQTSSVGASCFNTATGSATVVATSNFPGFSYEWNDSANQTGSTAENLAAGTYSVTVTDGDGCESSALVVVPQPPALNVMAPIVSDVSCNGANDGGAIALANGGTPGYTFVWSDGTESNALTFAAPGEYTVTVTDANGCENQATVVIEEPEVLTATFDFANVSCTGTDDGYATVIPAGGTGPYDFLWTQNGSTSASLTNLLPGDYEVTVTDDNNCTVIETVTILPSQDLQVQASVSSVSCFGETDGSASVTVTGGNPEYTYTWNDPNNQSGATATDLAPGTYTVSVVDVDGCDGSAEIVIIEPALLTAGVTNLNDALCAGQANGTATIVVNGGTPGYTYDWPGNFSGSTVNNLPAGEYFVTVQDANGCTTVVDVDIFEPAPMTANAEGISPTCFGGTNGSATVVASGGIPGYTYTWTGGQSGATASNLAAGQYTVTVVDQNGCTVTDVVNLTQPSAVVASLDSDPATCGLADGSVSASANGGNGPYQYDWPGLGESGANVEFVEAGTYQVVVTDANGCTGTGSVVVGTINEPVANASVNITEGYQPLTVTFTNLSLNADTYTWDFGDGSIVTVQGEGPVTHTFYNDGYYTVTVTAENAGGCTDTYSIDIIVFVAANLVIPNVFTPNGDGDNDDFRFFRGSELAVSIETFECTIFNRWGAELYHWEDVTKGWPGSAANGDDCAEGTYFFLMKAKGYDGTVYDVEGSLTLLR